MHLSYDRPNGVSYFFSKTLPSGEAYSTPTAIYSLRLVNPDWFGRSVINVRRSGDNAEKEFSASDIELGIMGDWITSGGLAARDAFVVDWYDQSGNSNHASQATAASQPKIWDSSTGLVMEGGRPALDFASDFLEVPSSTGSFKYLHDGTTSAVFGVVTFGKVANPDTAYYLVGNNGATSSKVGVTISYSDSSPSRNDANLLAIAIGISGNLASLDATDDAITPTEQKLMSYFFDADASASLRTQTGIDGGILFGNNTDTNAPSTSAATHNMQIGANGNDGNALTGYVQELIFYNTDQSANRTDIENNINAYYVVYGVLHYRQRVADDSGTFAIEDRDQTVYNSVTIPEMPSLICSCDAYKATKLYNINPA